MDGKFTRKACFVAGSHMTEPPTNLSHSMVEATDIGNAYLNAPCREKIWIVASSKFGSDQGSVMMVTQA
eukprot:9965868-Ditylum_brightwellii.AAC.1